MSCSAALCKCREVGHVGTVVKLLKVPPGGRSVNLARHKGQNLLRMLDTLRLLLSPPSAPAASSSPLKARLQAPAY